MGEDVNPPTRFGDLEVVGVSRTVGSVRRLHARGADGTYIVYAWATSETISSADADDLAESLVGLGPHILSPTTLGAADGWAWCAFPDEGLQPLDALLQQGPFLDEEWDELLRSMSKAVAAVHATSMPVGRLASADVFISSTGIPLLMFGCEALATRLGAPAGSLQPLIWLAPEQLDGQEATPESDIFALGGIAALTGTGRLPWGPLSTPTATLIQRMKEAKADTGGLDPRQMSLVDTMLQTDPTRRPSAPQVIDALSRSPLPDEPTEPPGRRPWYRSKGPLIGVGAGAVAVIVVTAALLSGLSGEPETEVEQVASSVEGEVTSDPAPGSDPTSGTSAAAEVLPSYTTRINYESTSIPDRVFRDALDWTFDVCLSDKALTTKANRDKIALFRYGDGKWTKQGATAAAAMGGRCGSSKVNVTLDRSEAIPAKSTWDEGWSKCVKYRVVIPETSNFAKTNIDFCIQTQTTTD